MSVLLSCHLNVLLLCLTSQRATVSRLVLSQRSSSKDIASRHHRLQLLAFLGNPSNCLLKLLSSTRPAATQHRTIQHKPLSLLITVCPLPPNLEWLQASQALISQGQGLHHPQEPP